MSVRNPFVKYILLPIIVIGGGTTATVAHIFYRHHTRVTRERAPPKTDITVHCRLCDQYINLVDFPKHRTYGRGDCPMTPPGPNQD